ncbi:MAG: GspE/PulE family protein [bacterium]|nr:GspE/PulE family protein [bacterium]
METQASRLENAQVKKALLAGNYVNVEDLQRAEQYSKDNHTSMVDFLLQENIISNDTLGQAMAEHFSVTYADLNTYPPSREQVLRIPERIGSASRVVLFKEAKGKVTVATDNPKRPDLATSIQNALGVKDVTIAYGLPDDVDAALRHYRKPLTTRFAEILAGKHRIAPELFDAILGDALNARASDVHFDAQDKEVVIRFRIDGVLHEAGRIPKIYYENLLNRVKVQSHLRIDEHYATQDGAMRVEHGGRLVDLRVSIAPTLDGEKIVLRLLGEYVKNFTLTDLGVASHDLGKVYDAIEKPFGMIIVCGPTGSGKTTTLYGILRMLNRPEVNIATIEDPVEYKVLGLNQIQVNADTNLTFATGLRSIARQDPDVIMVGEIRDQETADISVNAALTGHLLLSTFHANDAATAIPRLMEMGVEPFLLASTLELLVAQRLVRKLCEACRFSEPTSLADLEKRLPAAKHWFHGRTLLYHAKGCAECGGTGYKGRTGIFEFIHVTNELKERIPTQPSSSDIWRTAKKLGARSLFEDGIEKVLNGVTTLEELLRVATPAQ